MITLDSAMFDLLNCNAWNPPAQAVGAALLHLKKAPAKYEGQTRHPFQPVVRPFTPSSQP